MPCLKRTNKQVLAALFVLSGFACCPGSGFADSPFTESKVKIEQPGKSTDSSDSADNIAGLPCEGNVNCRWKLNVRSGPWEQIIDGFSPGKKVEIVAKEGLWYRIRYGSGFAYVHTALIDRPGLKASQGPNKSPYDNEKDSDESIKSNEEKDSNKKPDDKKDNDQKNEKTGGINGPAIPDCLLKGLAAAKKSQWFYTKDKCLQFAGTVAYKAGAQVSSSKSIYPHLAYKPDKSLRGSKINALDDAALAGKLKPGMLIHVKAAYDKDPAYNPVENAHHWFVYMGTQNGTPMFADCLRDGRLQTISEINGNMSAGRILQSKYKPYGNIRRVSAIYDPFADQR